MDIPYYNHNQRGPKQTPTVKRRAGDVTFRIVCHVSIIDGIFGSSDAVVPSICRETHCRIHCEEVVAGSDHRVISIVGPGLVDRRISLSGNNVGEEYREVSSAQEAVIRVFERVWEVEALIEVQTAGEAGDDVAYCGLLANTNQIGVLVGKRGRNVTRMRRETRAKIRMLPPPICAAKDDELIQIMGSTLAAKKALVAVTACLQDHPLVEKDPSVSNGHVEMFDHSYCPDSHTENCPQFNSSLTPLNGDSGNNASKVFLSSSDDVRDPCLDVKGTQREVAFRLLFSNKAAGGIIGTRGAIVRTLQNASGALITFAAPMTGSRERLVTISALENLDTLHSPAQKAVMLVFNRSVEVDGQQGFSSGLSKDATASARLLVGSDLIGCLTFKNNVVSEIRDVTGAAIQILGGQQILDCAAEDNVVVQITGNHENVRNALFQFTGRLRLNILYSKVLNEVRVRSPKGIVKETRPGLHQSVALCPDSKQEAALTGVDQSGPPKTRLQQPQTEGRGHTTAAKYGGHGSRSFGGSLELGNSLNYFSPTDVLNEMGARSSSGGVTETTSSVLQQSASQSPDSGQQNILMKGIAQLGLFDNIGSPSKLQSSTIEGRGHGTAITDAGRGSTAFAGGIELESGNKSLFVANTTVEIVIAEHMFGSVYGKDGGNLTRIKQISGAKVEVRDPRPGKSEGMVVISGMPDQTRIAQTLLQAFFLISQ